MRQRLTTASGQPHDLIRYILTCGWKRNSLVSYSRDIAMKLPDLTLDRTIAITREMGTAIRTMAGDLQWEHCKRVVQI